MTGTDLCTLYAAALSHKGRVRENNEDNLYFAQILMDQDHEGLSVRTCHGAWPVSPYHGFLFGVFDGMGGHADGEWASYITAVEAGKCEMKLRTAHADPAVELKELCIAANRTVGRETKRRNATVGTTAAMLYFSGDRVWSCNVGDSPIYQFRDGVLIPIYEEHTERGLYEALYGKEKAAKKKYALTQHIGIPEDEMLIEPYMAELTARPGDLYLICSDGLTDMVTEERICQIMGSGRPVEEIAERLKDEALQNGGRDNTTIIVVSL